MVNIISTQTDKANTEQMLLMGHHDDITTAFINKLVKKENLDVAGKALYDEVVAIGGEKSFVTLSNTKSRLSVDRITSNAISLDKNEMDFDSLTEVEKDSFRNFLALAISI